MWIGDCGYEDGNVDIDRDIPDEDLVSRRQAFRPACRQTGSSMDRMMTRRLFLLSGPFSPTDQGTTSGIALDQLAECMHDRLAGLVLPEARPFRRGQEDGIALRLEKSKSKRSLGIDFSIAIKQVLAFGPRYRAVSGQVRIRADRKPVGRNKGRVAIAFVQRMHGSGWTSLFRMKDFDAFHDAGQQKPTRGSHPFPAKRKGSAPTAGSQTKPEFRRYRAQ